MVASSPAGTLKDLRTLRPSILNGRYTEMHTKNSKQQMAESFKWQSRSENPNVISMDLINQKSAKPSQDYSVNKDGSKADKIGKVSVIEDPDSPDQYIGATAKDDDILKWAFNKGYKSVDVEILEHGSARIDSESIRNMARQNSGQYSNGIITVSDEKALNEIRKDLESLGIDVAQDGQSFSFVDSDTLKDVTVQIADKNTAQSARVVQNSDGIIKNRDFVSEIRKALTADGQIDSSVSDQELGVISQLAGMLGNDVTDRIEFVSAYSDSLTDAENKSLAGARGVTSFDSLKESARIILSDQSDASTVVHEMLHVALEYNANARKNLTDAVRYQMKTSSRRNEQKAFLSEHMGELSGFKNVEEAMKALEHTANNPSSLSAESKEVLTKMFEMFNSSDSRVKERMPSGIRKIFNDLADIFRNIYQNITGRSLMPDRIADAYAGFFSAEEKNHAFNSGIGLSQILQQRNISKEQFFKELTDKSKYTQYEDSDVWIDNERFKNLSLKPSEQENKKLRKEIKSALAFSKEFKREVFLLSENIGDDYYSVTKGKNPDAITDFKILEIKNITGGDNTLKSTLSDAAAQSSDIIYINISEDSAVANNFENVLNGKINVSESLDGKVIVFSVDDKGFKSFLINKKEKLAIASPWSARILEASVRRGYQSNSDNQNVNVNSDSVNNNILRQENLTPEQRVADNAKRHQKSTYSEFSLNDVHDMLDVDVFVPDSLLEKYSSDERVIAEKADRAVLADAFLADNEVRKALVEHHQIDAFLSAMKEYYGSGYNSNTESLLRKAFAYNRTQTPSQMRKGFRAEYGTVNIEKLMELKAMLTRRRVSKKSKNGKAYSQIYVPDTAETYQLIKNLDRTSSEADIKAVTDSINSNTNMWLRDYLKATELDYSRRFIDADVGSYDYLKAKSALMYLSLGKLDTSRMEAEL